MPNWPLVRAAGTLGALSLAGWRAYRRHRAARTFAIRTPNGIEEAGFHRIGGIDQWIQFRGEDRDNPVLLVLHGGPGCSYRGLLQVFHAWERHFSIVHWDQRGAGKTFGRNGRTKSAGMTIERMTEDAIEVAELVCERMRKSRIILVGLSYGSALGLGSVSRRPDLFHAYVGTGQMVHSARNEALSYRLSLDGARERGLRDAIQALERLGPPPYRSIASWGEMQKWSRSVEAAEIPAGVTSEAGLLVELLYAPNYSLRDVYDQFAAMKFAPAQLFDESLAFDAAAFGDRFAVPMVFIQGDRDLQTVTSLVEEYAARIEAPQKEFVVLEGGGHGAMMALSDRFLRELRARAPRWLSQ